MKKILCALLSVLMLLSLLSACGSTQSSDATDTSQTEETAETAVDTAEEPAAETEEATTQVLGGIIKVGLNAEPSTLYPNNQAAMNQVLPCLYDNLVVYNEKTHDYDCELATDYTWDDDLTLTIHLHEGVLFHNGVEMTSKDVYETLFRLSQNPVLGSNFSAVDFDATECPDDYTIVIHFSSPNAAFISTLANSSSCITCASYYEEVGSDDAYGLAPIGTGPYKMTDWTSGVSITLEAFDEYWNQDNAALNDGIVFSFIPEDETRIIELQTGGIDIAYNVSVTNTYELEGVDGVQVFSELGRTWYMLKLNPEYNQALYDQNVRLALMKALDREAIANALFGEYASVLNNWCAESVLGYTDEVASDLWSYDPDAAKEMLAEAGCSDLTLDIMIYENATLQSIAEVVANQWSAIGVTVNISVYDQMTWFSYYTADEFDCIIASTSNVSGDPDESTYTTFISTAQNRYKDEKLDELLDKTRSTTDADARLEAIQELYLYFQETVPQINLFTTYDIYAASTNLNNLPSPTEVSVRTADLRDVTFKS